jgi:integrase
MRRKRRGRGEGSIHERADGLWEAKVSLGYDGNCKRRRLTVYGSTKKEVQDKLRSKQNDLGRGVDVAAGRITLAQWLTRWLAMIEPTVEPNTYRPYERHVRLHIVPVLGTILLCQMKRGDIVNFYPELAKRRVSPTMQRKVGTTLTIALNKALDLDLLPSNPAMKVDKPKARKSDVRPLDPDQAAAFLQAARADRLFAFYRTALDSGARPGELFALTWQDVDVERGFISITKSLEEIGGSLRVKDPKTPKSRRRIDLSAETLAILKEHRKTMLAAGFIGGPVFCDTEGGHLRNGNLWRDSFPPICRRVGLPLCEPKKGNKRKGRQKAGDEPLAQEAKQDSAAARIGTATRRGEGFRLYDLRHTCATLLLLADVPAKIVSERLGHSSITVTLDIYSHVLPTMQKRAADTLGALLGRHDCKEAKGG